MKLSISNIAWKDSEDLTMYAKLREMGFSGLEIAPTRIFPDKPYNRLDEAKVWAQKLMDEFGLEVPSMQSIWYGRTENIFSDDSHRKALLDYTKHSILFAQAIGCRNLVFGCPRNRDTSTPDEVMPTAIEFFKEIGDFAFGHDTVVSIEANPPIYNTRFINTTEQAISLCKAVDSSGFLINLDVGTMVYNDEDTSMIANDINLVNHVHFSEPYLKILEPRQIHKKLLSLLKESGYQKYVSIEMGNTSEIGSILDTMTYLKNLCYDNSSLKN